MSKVWVTKYALTDGIQEFDAVEDQWDKAPTSMIVVQYALGMNGVAYFHGKDWHRTQEAAVKRAREMRLTKIASLEKQIAKLRKLSFGEQP